MKIKQSFSFVAFCFLFASSAFGQGAYIPARPVNSYVSGQLRPVVATVTVCAAGAAGIPCAPPLAGVLFKDQALTQPLPNPTTTDANGNYPTMALASGNYTITETASGFTGFSYQITVSCGIGTCTAASLTVTGTATLHTVAVSGVATFSGGLTCLTACTLALPLSVTGNGFTSSIGNVVLSGSRTWTLQDTSDTFVFRNTSDSLTNKTFTGVTPFPGNTAALAADWTCGTAGTVSSCVAATVVGSGGGVPLTFTLPLVAQSYTLECDGIVGQATAATANQWNLLTATNGATNVTALYDMYTAATAKAGGTVTDQASTTTTFQIAPSWTLGGTATKMPFHVWAKIEGASASSTVVSLQLVAPTVGDLVTIYRGTACRIY